MQRYILSPLVYFYTVINPRRACARVNYGSCLVCQSVCVSGSSCFHACLHLQPQVFLRHFDSWIFEKTFRSKIMAWKSQICKLDRPHREDQRTAGTTTGRSNIASDASYCRNRRVTSEIAASKSSSVYSACCTYSISTVQSHRILCKSRCTHPSQLRCPCMRLCVV